MCFSSQSHNRTSAPGVCECLPASPLKTKERYIFICCTRLFRTVSFVPKSHDRIYARRSPSRNVASRQNDHCEDHGGDYKRQRIEGVDTEEQLAQQPC